MRGPATFARASIRATRGPVDPARASIRATRESVYPARLQARHRHLPPVWLVSLTLPSSTTVAGGPLPRLLPTRLLVPALSPQCTAIHVTPATSTRW